MWVEVDPQSHLKILFGQPRRGDGPVWDEVFDWAAGFGHLLLGFVGLELVWGRADLWWLVGGGLVLALLFILLPLLALKLLLLLIIPLLRPYLLTNSIILLHLLLQHLL